LLDANDRRHLRAFAINKFRGDADLLTDGITRVTRETGLPCAGVLPHWGDLEVPEEDTLGWDGWQRRTSQREDRVVIGIADLPGISNFTDFEALAGEADVELVRLHECTTRPLDAMLFPGSKHTVNALQFVRAQGLDRLAHRVLTAGGTVGGICGGYQLLGQTIRDPDRVESSQAEIEGLGMLPIDTAFAAPKIVEQVSGRHLSSGCAVVGYQVRMGRTRVDSEAQPFLELTDDQSDEPRSEGMCLHGGRLFGTYLHGLFDEAPFRRWWLNQLRQSKGWTALPVMQRPSLDERLDRLADFVEQHLDTAMIERVVQEGV
jgi:cobyric acid synthase